MANYLQLLCLFALFCTAATAYESAPLQDFCVADPTSSENNSFLTTAFEKLERARVNGLACMDPKLVKADHFSFSGLHHAGNTSNKFGSSVTPVFAAQLPGLNTLGISMVRIDYAPWGLIVPHWHPRASEILTVLDGSIEVGFVTSNPNNIHITKVLQKGDVFVFPVGLVHYQRNVGKVSSVSISALSSQNPGVITVSGAVFGSDPSVSTDVLTKAFQLDKSIVDYLQNVF